MDVNLVPLLPAAQVLLAALVVMLLDLFFGDHEKPLLAWITIFGLALCAVDAMLLWGSREGSFGETFLVPSQVYVTMMARASYPVNVLCIRSPC